MAPCCGAGERLVLRCRKSGHRTEGNGRLHVGLGIFFEGMLVTSDVTPPFSAMRSFIARVGRWPHLAGLTPWAITARAAELVVSVSMTLDGDFRISNTVAVHETAIVESGAVVKGPAIIGPRCFVAASAYLRGGVMLEEDCIIGPGAELKTSLMFKGGKLAHFNFVGDSILGEGVNLEAGSVIANYRNERDDKRIRIATAQGVIDTGAEKFGALIGDGVRIGANAVIAPGALIAPHTIVPRLYLVDQSPVAA